MVRKELNLGILAHVDAGKTTLTERLLYEAGAIDVLGSVDAGTTQTDTLALERQRGITIRSAVASFDLGDVHVNLIDTPGHPDFIAEVERVLSVLDGAVLVVSGVEGVQPQTPLLMRALQRLGIPTLIFVNKLDRAGADPERVLAEIADRLTPAAVAPDEVQALAELDEQLLVEQTQALLAHPVFYGSAVTGAGVEELRRGITGLLPAAAGDPDGPFAGTVFKIERGPGGEKVAYVRLFSGTVRVRDRLRFGSDGEAKVTALAVFDRGSAVPRAEVSAGAVAKLWGLADVQVGDRVGEPGTSAGAHQFPPPTLESVVAAADPDDGHALRIALAQLAEQDPLIDVRQDDERHELSVSLYGEVQKEVLQATLAEEYGLDVEFRETTPLCIERPRATGEGLEVLHAETNPYNAALALRIEPAAAGSGLELVLAVDHESIPLYVYGTAEGFREQMTAYVRDSLQRGPYGWPVVDCRVTVVDSAYSVADGPPSRRGPTSKAIDFRKLTPLVVRRMLDAAGTVVCEPVVRVDVEVPAAAVGVVMAALGRLGGAPEASSLDGRRPLLSAVLTATHADELQRQLPGLTSGEGVLASTFAGYEPVVGEPPRRG